MRVVENDAIDHDEDANALDLLHELTKRVLPCRSARALSDVEADGIPDRGCRRDDILTLLNRADERQIVVARCPREASVPVLPLLAYVDRFEEVGAWGFGYKTSDRSEIRDRDSLVWRFRQEEVP